MFLSKSGGLLIEMYAILQYSIPDGEGRYATTYQRLGLTRLKRTEAYKQALDFYKKGDLDNAQDQLGRPSTRCRATA
ncbi:MAG: hypothetical protein IPK17_08720 [Chloroflexi bacterium]|uniref:hypothetical protein n=1 Tax=Candidatus Flexifilum breve TaxID=3140694 RepID=UPI0031355504|nr:hypothetical protein [Chloroflexota bacterium]